MLGLPPRAGPSVRVLILGSFPGARSLRERRYYANPQNRFWRALAPSCAFTADAHHEARIAALHARGIALWDVLHACRREGSLDQGILRGSEEPNDLSRVVGSHAELRAILLNGRSVAEFFHRHQIPRGFWPDLGVEVLTLPSTSPAHAAMPTAEVVRVWTETLDRFVRA
ncbi:MAG: DNA-deoxyinosine glycosylase [Gemmatimonadetes bacterium]|nr:DNA-deoxyinosine glycosylase [Gemmatimonadota bacterium]